MVLQSKSYLNYISVKMSENDEFGGLADCMKAMVLLTQDFFSIAQKIMHIVLRIMKSQLSL